MMELVRRGSAALFAALVVALLVVHPAAAKMPYFSIETRPSMPAPGEQTEVLVRFWSDPAHQTPAQWTVQEVMTDLLCVFPANHVVTGSAGCPGGIGLTLHRQDDSTFTATFTMPATGSWTLVAFPAINRPLPAGSPDQVPIGSLPAEGGPAIAHNYTIVWIAAILLVLLGASIAVVEQRRRVRARPAPSVTG